MHSMQSYIRTCYRLKQWEPMIALGSHQGGRPLISAYAVGTPPRHKKRSTVKVKTVPHKINRMWHRESIWLPAEHSLVLLRKQRLPPKTAPVINTLLWKCVRQYTLMICLPCLACCLGDTGPGVFSDAVVALHICRGLHQTFHSSTV